MKLKWILFKRQVYIDGARSLHIDIDKCKVYLLSRFTCSLLHICRQHLLDIYRQYSEWCPDLNDTPHQSELVPANSLPSLILSLLFLYIKRRLSVVMPKLIHYAFTLSWPAYDSLARTAVLGRALGCFRREDVFPIMAIQLACANDKALSSSRFTLYALDCHHLIKHPSLEWRQCIYVTLLTRCLGTIDWVASCIAPTEI